MRICPTRSAVTCESGLVLCHQQRPGRRRRTACCVGHVGRTRCRSRAGPKPAAMAPEETSTTRPPMSRRRRDDAPPRARSAVPASRWPLGLRQRARTHFHHDGPCASAMARRTCVCDGVFNTRSLPGHVYLESSADADVIGRRRSTLRPPRWWNRSRMCQPSSVARRYLRCGAVSEADWGHVLARPPRSGVLAASEQARFRRAGRRPQPDRPSVRPYVRPSWLRARLGRGVHHLVVLATAFRVGAALRTTVLIPAVRRSTPRAPKLGAVEHFRAGRDGRIPIEFHGTRTLADAHFVARLGAPCRAARLRRQAWRGGRPGSRRASSLSKLVLHDPTFRLRCRAPRTRRRRCRLPCVPR